MKAIYCSRIYQIASLVLSFSMMMPMMTYALNVSSLQLSRETFSSVTISDSEQLGLDVADDLTIEAWVKFESLALEDQMTFVSKRLGDLNNERSFFFGYEIANGIRFTTWRDGQNFGVHGTIPWDPSLDRWYHVAVSKLGAQAVVYIDGEPYGSPINGVTGLIYNGTAGFSVGADYDDNAGHFDGLMDEVRIWDIARDGADIAADRDNELAGNEPGLVGYWRFNDDSLTDATANGNDLTNVNGATFSTDVPFSDTPPLTPVEQAEALIVSVEGYDLPKHVANMYLANLKKVPRFIEEGKLDEALDQLIAFVSKVQRHQADGTISDEVANELLKRAEELMLAII